MEPSETVALYGAAWAEPDEQVRREILKRCWAPDGVYEDPTARVEGREALAAHIGGFLERMPGHRIDMASGVDHYGGRLRFAWRMVGPDGPALDGVDFGELADDGKLVRITGFFGPWPAVED